MAVTQRRLYRTRRLMAAAFNIDMLVGVSTERMAKDLPD
jgi:hypothetical protein